MENVGGCLAVKKIGGKCEECGKFEFVGKESMQCRYKKIEECSDVTPASSPVCPTKSNSFP